MTRWNSDSSAARRLRALVAVVSLAALGASALAIGSLYRTGVEQEQARLWELAYTNAHLVESVARFDAAHSQSDHPEGAVGATLSQVVAAQRTARRGSTELVFGWRRQGSIEFAVPPRDESFVDAGRSEAMRRSVAGESGVTQGRDYRGVEVLAAYMPIEDLGIGLVAKVDMAQVRAPYIRAGAATAAGALLLILLGALLATRLGGPLLERIGRSEERYRGLIETMREGIAVVGDDGELVLVNGALSEMLGRERESLVGRPFRELPFRDEEERALAEARLASGGQQGFEVDFTRGDGVTVSTLASQSEVLVADTPSTLFVLSNVTERRRAADMIRRANEELEERVRERSAALEEAQEELVRAERLAVLGELTGIVAHELRNPLGTVKNSLFVVESFGLEKLEPHLARASRAMDRCEGIVSDLLEFARPKAVVLSPTSVDPWIASVLGEAEIPAGVELEVELGLGDLTIGLDQEKLRRALINVVENAFHAILEEGQGTIRVTSEPQNGGAAILVDDTGPGVPEDVADRILEPLFSTKPFGTGLGLSIVQRTVTAHGGELEITNGPTGGGRVRIWLPA